MRRRGPHRLARPVGAALLVAAAAAAAAPTAPSPPTHFVTDPVGFLSPQAAAELDRRLSDSEHASGHQVLLWIGRTTAGEAIETWAVRVFAAWRVGRKGLDDGVVLFVMTDDRTLRIEVGYGLEDSLPDVRAARIIREQIAPRLRAGDHDGAARAGVEAILDAVGGDAAPDPGIPHPTIPELVLLGIVGLLVLGFVVSHPGLALLMLTNLGSGGGRRGDRRGWSGGGFGGGGFTGGGGRSGGGGASGSW